MLDPRIRTIVVISSGQAIHSVEEYAAVRDRIETARAIPLASEDSRTVRGELGCPLVQTDACISRDEGDAGDVVPLAFSPALVAAIYALPESADA